MMGPSAWPVDWPFPMLLQAAAKAGKAKLSTRLCDASQRGRHGVRRCAVRVRVVRSIGAARRTADDWAARARRVRACVRV